MAKQSKLGQSPLERQTYLPGLGGGAVAPASPNPSTASQFSGGGATQPAGTTPQGRPSGSGGWWDGFATSTGGGGWGLAQASAGQPAAASQQSGWWNAGPTGAEGRMITDYDYSHYNPQQAYPQGQPQQAAGPVAEGGVKPPPAPGTNYQLPPASTTPPPTPVARPQFNALNGYDPSRAPVVQSGQWWTLPNGGAGAALINIQDPLEKAYYTNSDPQSFYTQAIQQVTGNDLQSRDFLARMFPTIWANYLNAASVYRQQGGGDLLFPDYLTGDVVRQAFQQYQIQAPQARGIDPRLYDAGRFDTSY